MEKTPKLTIMLVTPGMAFHGRTLTSASLGGSETMGLMMGRALADRGHQVFQLCNCPRQEVVDGVIYVPIANAQHLLKRPADVVIGQRGAEIFASPMPLASKIRILWHHDVAIYRFLHRMAAGTWNVTDHWVLSQWQKEQYRQVYGLPEDSLWVTRNALDLELINRTPRPAKGRSGKTLVYSARPERGLECLLKEVMPRIWKEDPEVRLCVAGYDNTTPEMAPFYQHLWGILASDPARMVNLGPMPKPKLYELMANASAYVYPTTFSEISCITAMECQALGLPFIHTGEAALAETVLPGCGLLVPRPEGAVDNLERTSPDMGIHSTAWLDAFAGAVLGHLKAPEKGLEEERTRKLAARAAFGVEDLAQSWEDRIFQLFDRVNDNPLRLAKSFYFRSEIDGARIAIELGKVGPEEEKKAILALEERIHRDFDFTHRDQYEKIVADTDHLAYNAVPNEPRFGYMVQWIQNMITTGKLPDNARVLDYGCAYLGWVGQLAKRFPKFRFFGVDISQEVLNHGERLLGEDQDLKDPQRVAWCQGDICLDGPGPQAWELEMKRHLGGAPDLVLCLEVLEHVPDPSKLLERLDGVAKEGGWIAGTSPWGPWEEMSYDTYPHRCHLREIEEADLVDLVGHKRDYECEYLVVSQHNRTMDPLGIFTWWWQKDGRRDPVGRIDMARKLRIQAPRQLISVCMITRNAEAMLDRTLKSVKGLADEIRVVDTGSTDTTLEILKRHGALVENGLPPLEVNGDGKPHGFDQARNQSILHAIGDWILWIDADEELTNVARLFRYLQANAFDAYQVRQVHLTVDPPPGTMKPDRPARLFRNGRGFRFYGVVHEHPEKGAPNSGPGFTFELPDLDIAHDGYLTEAIRQGRYFRNINLMVEDRKRYPERLLGRFLMVRDWVQGARFELGRNGGRVTPWVREVCQAAVAEIEGHLITSGAHLEDVCGYLTEAMTYLNRGHLFRAYLSMKAPGEQDGPVTPLIIRAESEDLVLKILQAANRSRKDQLTSPWF